MRVSIVGGTISGNRGAEAMLVTTIGRIREFSSTAEFFVFSYYPHKDRELCKDERVKIHDCRPLVLALIIFPLAILASVLKCVGLGSFLKYFPSNIRDLESSKVLLDVGGITFSDGRAIFLLYNVISLLPAMLLRVRVVKLSQAMGPFNSGLNKALASATLSRCYKVFARGERTKENLSSLSISQSNFSRANDIAFLYDSNYSLSIENEDYLNIIKGKLEILKSENVKIVTLIPSSLVYSKDETYLAKLVKLTDLLVSLGRHVVLVPNATREGSLKLRNNDIRVIDLLVESLSPEVRSSVSFVNKDVNTKGIRDVLSFSELAISSRFHGMIASLALRIPVVVIGWSHKYREVMEEFSLGDCALDFSLSEEALLEALKKVFQREKEIKEKIEENIAKVQDLSMEQFDFLRDHIK